MSLLALVFTLALIFIA